VGGAASHLSSPEFVGIFMSSAMAVFTPARTKAEVSKRLSMISSFGERPSCAGGEASQLKVNVPLPAF
jgi:hypothetical protein